MNLGVIAANQIRHGESGQILLEGDEQSGTDALLLEGDQTDGDDVELFSE